STESKYFRISPNYSFQRLGFDRSFSTYRQSCEGYIIDISVPGHLD
ncbi:12216_t:CDS:1, partial [Acaulospora colombiana]